MYGYLWEHGLADFLHQNDDVTLRITYTHINKDIFSYYGVEKAIPFDDGSIPSPLMPIGKNK